MTKEFNRHDNIDYEIVEVGRDTLLLKLQECSKYASLPTETVGYGGIFFTLFAAVSFTETTRGLWLIPGEVIQATFLVGCIVAGISTVAKGISWYKVKKEYTPEAIVESLAPKGPRIAGLLPGPVENKPGMTARIARRKKIAK